MKEKLTLALVVLLTVGSALAADGKSVSYKSGDETVQGVLYTPCRQRSVSRAHRHSRVVGTERLGQGAGLQARRRRLCHSRCRSLSRQSCNHARHGSRDHARSSRRPRQTRPAAPPSNFSTPQPNVKKDRIGSIGWCMGGGYSLDVALQEPTLAATVINYGHLATDHCGAEENQRADPRTLRRAGSWHHSRRRSQVRASP